MNVTSKFFINVTHHGLTVHMQRGATATCLRGKKRIPAVESDMYKRDGSVEVLGDKPYHLYVCKFCANRLRLYRKAGQ